MKQILIVLIFMACALVENPEDYAWIDSERSAGIAAEFSLEREFSSRDEADFRYHVEQDPDDSLKDHENMFTVSDI
jgi:hypothetical protein